MSAPMIPNEKGWCPCGHRIEGHMALAWTEDRFKCTDSGTSNGGPCGCVARVCVCDGWPGDYEGFREDCPTHGREAMTPGTDNNEEQER